MENLGENKKYVFCKDCLTPKQEEKGFCINCNYDFTKNEGIIMTETQFTAAFRKPCRYCKRPIIENVRKCFACKQNQF